MPTVAIPPHLGPQKQAHLRNIADNIQLLADLGYADLALAVPDEGGQLLVIADARPNTALAPVLVTRVGRHLAADEEIEAYASLASGAPVAGTRTRSVRGIVFTTSAFPIGVDHAYAVLVIDLASQVREGAGTMESAFMKAAEELIDLLRIRVLADARSGEHFSTVRRAGDGVLRTDGTGRITYASPNAINIMRLAGHEGSLMGTPAAELPGGGWGIAPVVEVGSALAEEIEVAGRTLLYRSIRLESGALVLVQDVTESRRREAELKVKEATIREVHHRVKNNLQTIASLLRIQARRMSSPDARHALEEATGRVSSMAVVHDMLAGSDEERIDFAVAASTVVELVRKGMLGERSGITVRVEGESGLVDAHAATSLALALAELVHNAIEHGLYGRSSGVVQVSLNRLADELLIAVRDDGVGLPHAFNPAASANLGLEIVRTVVEDDLRGTICFSGGRGTTVTIRVPMKGDTQ